MKAVCESMMNYEQFKDYVTERVSEFYQGDASVSLISVVKNNDVKRDGIVIRSDDDIACPTIYINNFYSTYMDGERIEDIIREIVDIYERSKLRNPFDAGFYSDFEKMKEQVAFKLVSRERNELLLKEVPHREFLDLAVVYVCMIRESEFGTASILIRNEHLCMWDKSEKDLHSLAIENTPNLMPSSLKKMKDILCGIVEGGDVDSAMEDIYVLSNVSTVNGATCILYDDVLENVANIFENSFYIIPSSIHEVILISDDEVCGEALATILHQVNSTEVSPEEVLSDSLYYFDRDTRKISVYK